MCPLRAAGNQSASEYAQPTLFGWLDARDRKQWPTFIRGDNAHASERMMVEAEKRQLPYLFKLRQTPNVSRTIGRLAKQGDKAKWQKTEQGWESLETTLRLKGWTRERRVIVSRRKLAEPKVEAGLTTNKQPCLPGMSIEKSGGDWYEYSVLVTSWEEMDLGRLTQEYRNRADAENMFDELKNQWGWSGYTTQDLKRSQLMARLVGLTYNWWGIYTRMGTGGQHREAITTRPALADGVAERTEPAREVKLEMTSLRGKAKKIATFLSGISEYLHKFLAVATQLDEKERWRALLRRIFWFFYPQLQPAGCSVSTASPLQAG
jgi:hypothetical protein